MDIKTRLNASILAGLQRAKTKKVVLLASGGVESTAAGILLQKQGLTVYPMFVNYGQRAAEAELTAAGEVSQKLGFQPVCEFNEPNVLKLGHGFIGGDQVVDDDNAWVPGRNTLLMMLAGIYGMRLDADGLAIGYCLNDNFVFGDNDLTHHQLVAATLTRSFERPFEVILPLQGLTKTQAVKLLLANQVFDSTVSCWNATLVSGRVISCGQCANCLERQEAIGSLSHESA